MTTQSKRSGGRAGVFRRLAAATLGLGLIVMGLAAPMAQAADPVTFPDAITSVTVTPHERVSQYDPLKVDATWNVGNKPAAGSTFELLIPDEIRPNQVKPFDLKTPDGTVVGACVVQAQRILCTLNENASLLNNVRGTLSFNAQAEKQTTETEIKWEQGFTTTFENGIGPVKETAPTGPAKYSWMDPNGRGVVWQLKFAGKDLVNVTIKDELGDGQQIIEGTAAVYEATPVNGQVTGWNRLPASRYTVVRSADGTSFTFTLNGAETKKVYKVEYITAIPDGMEIGDIVHNKMTAAGGRVIERQQEIKDASGTGDGDVPPGELSWTKVGPDKALLAGSEWTLAGPKGSFTVVDNGINDDDPVEGQLKVDELNMGEYTLTETKAPAGFQLNDQPFTATLVIGTNETASFGAVENTPVLGSVAWNKVDAAGGALAGSEWKLTGSGGDVAVVDNGSNDEDPAVGALKVSKLALGDYTLVETKAPAGYVLDETTHKVTIAEDSGLNPTFGDVVNAPVLGSIVWNKVDGDGKALAGSEWKLSGANGDVAVVDNGSNDEDPADGALKVSKLALGDYTLVETKAPAGYVLDETAHQVTITDGAGANVTLGDVVNKPIVGSVAWNKVDSDGQALAGSEWKLSGADGDLAVVDNGSNDADPADGALKVLDLPLGDYTLVETKAPAGFVLDTTAHAVTIGEGDAQNVVVGDVVNKPILGSVAWNKVDGKGEALEGSEWKLTGPAGDVAVVDNGDADEDPAAGALKVSGLALGDYSLVETKAPVGYELDSTVHKVKITAGDGENVTFGKIENKQILGEIDWSKTDPDGIALAGSEWLLDGPNGKITVVDNGANDVDPEDGILKVTGLAWGTYTLRETKAPEGYVADSTVRELTIAGDNLTVSLDPVVNMLSTPPATPPTTSTPPTPPTTTSIPPKPPVSSTPPVTPPLVNTGVGAGWMFAAVGALALTGIGFVLINSSRKRRHG